MRSSIPDEMPSAKVRAKPSRAASSVFAMRSSEPAPIRTALRTIRTKKARMQVGERADDVGQEADRLPVNEVVSQRYTLNWWK
jgi:hypothetical protein